MPNGSTHVFCAFAMACSKSAAVSSSHLGESVCPNNETATHRASAMDFIVCLLPSFRAARWPAIGKAGYGSHGRRPAPHLVGSYVVRHMSTRGWGTDIIEPAMVVCRLAAALLPILAGAQNYKA